MIPVEIDPEHRRSAMLARLLRALCVLVGISAVALMVNPPSFQPRWAYAAMTTSMFGVLALAYGLNRAGRYRPAAWLTILVACAGPWGSVLIDPSILAGDVVPLSFAVVPILLSALLLSPLGTVLVGALQLALLTVVLTLSPELDSVNWPSLLSLVVFVSILSVVVNQTTLADWAQIDRQTQQLSGYAATLREQTVRDPLTGLFNRRYLEETLERELARARRAGTTIGVIMVDVDRFKPFNDTHGHLAGDALLRSIGALLQGQVPADIALHAGVLLAYAVIAFYAAIVLYRRRLLQ